MIGSSGRNPERLSRGLLTRLTLGRAVCGIVPPWLANILSLRLASGGTQVRQNSGGYNLRDRPRFWLALSRGSLTAASEALENLFCLSQCLTLSGSDGEALMPIALRQGIATNGIKPVISTSE